MLSRRFLDFSVGVGAFVIGLSQILVSLIIQTQHDSKELRPGHGFWLCTHFDLDHCRYDLAHSYDKPSVHGQLLCKILSRSNMAVRSYSWTRNLPICLG